MAITKLVITGNTTAVGISTTPITISLMNKAASTIVTPDDNITATNVQAALEELDDIKVQATNGTLSSPTITGTATFATATFTSLTTTGNVGVGLSSPSAPLHVSGNIKTSGGDITVESSLPKVYLTDTDNNSDYSIVNNNGSLRIFDETNSAVRMSIDSTGQLGIGVTSPNFKLDVDGNFSASYMSLNSNASTPAVSAFVYRPASDELGLGTANTERVRIDGSGKVGIGTTSPESGLHVQNSSLANGVITVERDTKIKGTITAGNSTGLTIDVNNTQGGTEALRFSGNGVERMRIDASGNVGIGETNPNKKLHIKDGDVRIESTFPRLYLTDTDSNSDYSIINTNGKFSIYDDSASAYRMAIDSSGNVGIGTTSPETTLDVKSKYSFNNASNGAIRVQNHSSDAYGSFFNIAGTQLFDNSTYYGSGEFLANGDKSSGIVLTDGTIRFKTNSGLTSNTAFTPTERMRIDTSGNVGIGTSSPSYLLNVKGDDASILIQDSTTGFANQASGVILTCSGADGTPRTDVQRKVKVNGDALTFTRGVSDTEHMRIDSSGNVGIGNTTTPQRLTVGEGVATIGLQPDDTNGSYIRVGGTGASTNILRILGHNDVEKMRIDASGNVGIGTTSPAQKLDVNGNIRVQGTYPKIEFVDTDSNPDVTLIGGNGVFLVYDETNNTERMRIDSSGNVLVGTTDENAFNGGFSVKTGTVPYINVGHASSVTSGNYYAAFRHGTNTLGTITQNGTTGVLYNTSSDERLKENIADSADAGSKVDAIQIRQFDWIADGSHQDYGVIAQELVTVAPEAVHQPEDSEEMMGVDYSKLVPMLIKEVQTLRNRVAQLENN